MLSSDNVLEGRKWGQQGKQPFHGEIHSVENDTPILSVGSCSLDLKENQV